MKMLQVRCCCNPEKLLGYLPVTRYRGPIWENSPDCWRERYLLRIPSGDSYSFQEDFRVNAQIELWVNTFGKAVMRADGTMHGESYKAIKAEGVPIETLRRINGFTETPLTEVSVIKASRLGVTVISATRSDRESLVREVLRNAEPIQRALDDYAPVGLKEIRVAGVTIDANGD